MTDRELYLYAKKQLKYAYAPYSKLHVAAALECEDGTVFTGVNVENSSYGATICAERTAMVKAISEGHKDFKNIAVVCQDGTAWPCGICRQFMFEFGDDIRVISGMDEDHIEVYTISELLLNGFRLENK